MIDSTRVEQIAGSLPRVACPASGRTPRPPPPRTRCPAARRRAAPSREDIRAAPGPDPAGASDGHRIVPQAAESTYPAIECP